MERDPKGGHEHHNSCSTETVYVQRPVVLWRNSAPEAVWRHERGRRNSWDTSALGIWDEAPLVRIYVISVSKSLRGRARRGGLRHIQIQITVADHR